MQCKVSGAEKCVGEGHGKTSVKERCEWYEQRYDCVRYAQSFDAKKNGGMEPNVALCVIAGSLGGAQLSFDCFEPSFKNG